MTTSKQTYRIVKLHTSNFQRLTAEGVEIVPNQNLITLAGGNGEGKSSVLTSIMAVLRGKKYLPDQPVHHGADKAETFIDFGDFTAELKISAKSGPRIVVKSKTGAEITGPQTFLADKSNEILLDLTAFIRKGETPEGRRQQAELLRCMVGIDFTALDAEKQKAYDERTAINRDIQSAKGKLSGFPYDPAVPAEEIKLSEINSRLQEIQTEGMAEITRAQETNRQNGERRNALANSRNALAKSKQELAELGEEIESIREMLAKKEALYNSTKLLIEGNEKTMAEEAPKVEALQDININEIRKQIDDKCAPLLEQINQADTINSRIRTNRRHNEIKQEIADHESKATALSKRIEEIEKQKADMLAGAKYPLEGLSFNDSGILLNGLPLSSASTAEQLKAVLAIGFALNPEIRVAIIREGSLFDQDSLKELSSILDKWDGQAWLEDNRSTDPQAFVIEDGSLKE